MIFSYLLNMQSHPSWVCGLKLFCRDVYSCCYRSHPSWVCGLKLLARGLQVANDRHTLRGCVD